MTILVDTESAFLFFLAVKESIFFTNILHTVMSAVLVIVLTLFNETKGGIEMNNCFFFLKKTITFS